MSKWILIVFIGLATCQICFGQDTLRTALPMVKESSEVDSLIQHVLNSESMFNHKHKNDSCFLIQLTADAENNFIIGVKAQKSKKIIFGINHFISEKEVAYFEYDGYLVFIYGEPVRRKYIKKTKSEAEFTFINKGEWDVVEQQHYIDWFVNEESGKLYNAQH